VLSRVPLGADVVENALEKLWVHGGAKIDSPDSVARGGPQWERSYLARRNHKVEQLERITRFAASRNCRVVQLVEHFGDQEDDGHRCGACDICAPGDCVAFRFRPPNVAERADLERILEALLRANGQASGRLHRELFGEARDRDEFERLVGGLVRGGFVLEQADSFEKDGRVIEYRRLFLASAGRKGKDLESVPMAGLSPQAARRSQPRAARRAPAVSTNLEARLAPLPADSQEEPGAPRHFVVAPVRTRAAQKAQSRAHAAADPAVVDALRDWRLGKARSLEVPAFCILSNRTLEGIARAMPANEADLLAVKGVGPKVVEKFGAAILARLRQVAQGQGSDDA